MPSPRSANGKLIAVGERVGSAAQEFRISFSHEVGHACCVVMFHVGRGRMTAPISMLWTKRTCETATIVPPALCWPGKPGVVPDGKTQVSEPKHESSGFEKLCCFRSNRFKVEH